MATDTTLNTPPSLAAARMRQHRWRRKNRLRVITLEIRESEIDTLVRRGLLPQETRNDADAVRTGLYAILDKFLV